MIKFLNVTKEYSDTRALDGISFEISNDKITGIIGHNGAGKTTLFMIANGLAKPSSGDVIINNYSLSRERKKIQSITGLFTDKLHLYGILTVKECLMYFLQIHGQDKKSYNKYVDEFKLSSFENKRISELSTGMLKKVLLAISMVNNPQVLFLDEPFSGLDPEARLDFGQIIKDIKDKKNVQVLISSHDLLELELIIDNLLILKKGKLLANSSLSDLMSLYFKEKKIIVEVFSLSENDIFNIWNKIKIKSGKDVDKPSSFAKNLYRFKLNMETYNLLNENLTAKEKVLSMYDYKPTLDDLYFKITK